MLKILTYLNSSVAVQHVSYSHYQNGGIEYGLCKHGRKTDYAYHISQFTNSGTDLRFVDILKGDIIFVTPAQQSRITVKVRSIRIKSEHFPIDVMSDVSASVFCHLRHHTRSKRLYFPKACCDDDGVKTNEFVIFLCLFL